ncbi:hypothetical protein JTE90_016070, partial [Oedothorax gibbosus]
VFILLTVLATSLATPAYEYPYYVNTGTSKQYRSQDDVGNYQFGYDEGHSSGGTFRKEYGDAHGNKYGSYGLTDADGRVRVVNYVADENGFRADVRTNEPGTVPDDPASATFNKQAFFSVPSFAGIAYGVKGGSVKTPPSGVKTSGVKTVTKTGGVKTPPPVTASRVKTSPAAQKPEPIEQVRDTKPEPIEQVRDTKPEQVEQERVSKPEQVEQANSFKNQPEFPPFPKPLLYAPDFHSAATSEFPLLYRNNYFSNYKGSPYTTSTRRAFNTYKGSPYVSTFKGTPYVGSPYVGSPYVASPYVGRPYGRYGYYVYP